MAQKNLQISLGEELHMQFKLMCVERSTTMSTIACELIQEWVDENEEKEEEVDGTS